MKNFKTAKDVATEKIVYVDGLASTHYAIKLMKENNVEALVIQKRNDADETGIITCSDIISGTIKSNRTLDEISVYELMKKPVVTIPANMNVKYVPRLMQNCNISVAPVEENGTYIGMITYKTLLFAEV